MSEDKPSLWNTVKKKTSAFVKRVLDYLPRGILITGLIFAASAGLENLTDYHLLNISTSKWPEIAAKAAFHIGVGSIIAGTMGAYLCPTEENKNAPCPANDANAAKKELSNERARTQDIGDDFAISDTNKHLPRNSNSPNKPQPQLRTS